MEAQKQSQRTRTKGKKGTSRLIAGGRDLTTLVGEAVRVQTNLVGVPRFIDGVLMRVIAPLESGKGAGIRLRTLTKQKHKKPIYTTVGIPPQTPNNGGFGWRYETVIKYKTVTQYQHTTLPLSGLRSVHPLLNENEK